MYYELYLDVLFFSNFMMDSLLLFSVKKVMRFSAACGRIFLAAALGAFLMCLSVVFPVPGVVKMIFLTAAGPAMLEAAFGIRNAAQFLKAWGCLYVTAFLLGGILQALHPYVRTGSFFFTAAAAAYGLLSLCWKFLTRAGREQRKICEALLVTGSGSYRIHALVDTGNSLTDPLSREPVSVIDKSLAQKIWKDGMESFRYIPYCCVGRQGVLPVIRLEKMCVYMQEEQWITSPLVGISEVQISQNEKYQMILNPDLLDRRNKDGCKSSSATAL